MLNMFNFFGKLPSYKKICKQGMDWGWDLAVKNIKGFVVVETRQFCANENKTLLHWEGGGKCVYFTYMISISCSLF